MMEPVRVYVDTSVFGGVFDDEFQEVSRSFFKQARKGRFQLVCSTLVRNEIAEAPEQVRSFFDDLAEIMETADIPSDAVDLQLAYLNAGILSENAMTDALHVATATVMECDVIVSWNFRHIVHFQKIPLNNKINRELGYADLAIHAPLEMIGDENEAF